MDTCQRRPNFVAHGGEKIGLGTIGRLRFDAGLLGNLRGSVQLARLLVTNSDVAHNPGKALLAVDIAPFRH